MVFTKQILVFSRLNDDEVVDSIKLHEIKNIKDTSARVQTGQMNIDPENENSKMSNTKSENAKKMFQIETSEEGYNAGRVYTIQLKSETDFNAIINDLSRFCKIARDKAEARTRFKRTQDRVSKIFNSNPVQGFLALLIFTVNALWLVYRFTPVMLLF